MIQAIELKTEYLCNPMGIDIVQPRVFWKAANAVKQTAFQIRYAVNDGQWCTCAAEDSDSMCADLPVAFHSRDRVRWQVLLWDEAGKSGQWSKEAAFEIGLLENSEWSAKWIMGNYAHNKKPDIRYPADCFRKAFRLEGEIERARLYITACGIYETHLNGKRIGEQVLTPGSMAFHKRVHYQTYDVTGLLQNENLWDIQLADGFYAGKTGAFEKVKTFGYEPKVLAQLEIYQKDGNCIRIETDNSFRWSNDGSVRFSDMKDGEVVDYRCKASFCANALETKYSGLICASDNVPVKEQERFTDPKVIICPDGQTVLDFGQNLAGYMEATVSGPSGHKCSMVFGEKLDECGNFTVANIAYKGDYNTCHFQTNDLICDGGCHTYKPKFTVMGFRYVLLQNWPEKVDPQNFTAIAVYSDMDSTFCFSSSDATLNKIVENTLWSVKGNFLDVPTDCPTRERAGWTGDAQLFFNTGNYMMDQRAFFRKWLRDVADCQKKNGLVYNINPSSPGKSAFIEWISMEGSSGWGDAMITIPWYFWKRYGDDCLMREFWQPMEKCFAFFRSRLGKRNLFSLINPGRSKYDKYIIACGRHFGEWTEPADCAPPVTSLLFPLTEEATAYFSYSARIMGEMAAHLGKTEATDYIELADKSRESYNYYFVQNGDIQTNRMCKYVRPCGLGLVRAEVRRKLLHKTVELNRQRNYRIGTGFLTTPFVFEMLSEAGDSDGAYRTLTNPDIGWAQQIAEGATTVWENWTPDASLNHYSKGACCQWLFDCICGVQLDGTKNYFRIAPHVISQVNEIHFSYDSVYGTVSSGWERSGNSITYNIEIPANCEAELLLPGGKQYKLAAGRHQYVEEV